MKNASLSLEQIKKIFPGTSTTIISNKRSVTVQKYEQLSFLEIELEILSNHQN
ncbi:hypothetical protein [Gottfriedia acidiceleris]|uniref:hypothetical protein n=1 Tax=Gottfriedia acidiceleris TaxID=371036 RepID=UPI00142F8538|nr:hypothetical protein [Gottfriedia acidiceleris]